VIEDAAGFAAALTDLRSQVALTIREVSRRTGIPSATLGGYFSGRHLPPPTQPAQLADLLSVLGVPEQQHEEWRAALNRVRRIPGPRTPGKVVPYRGLEPYGVRDAAWFVGREELVDQLHQQVAELFDQEAGSRIVTLVGASGTGKSSLLRAGVMARLAMEGVTPVLLAPGEDPPHALATALARFRPDARKRLVVVDQLEEVLAEAVRPIVREAFLSSLVDLSEQPGTVVVTAIRADFYGRAVEDATLRTMLRRPQVLVEPMDEPSLRRVVIEPARRAGATVEAELVELVLRDLSPRSSAPESSLLPMLSHALLATWRHARNARLGVSDYVAVGGVGSAVQRTAEEIYSSLDEEDQEAARWLFSQLVNVDEEGVPTRRRLETADLEDRPSTTRVVEAFVAGRIVTATEQTLELSHEVLLTIWPRLDAWLTADRDALRLRRRISMAASTWDAGGREPAQLLSGPLLELARPLSDDPEAGLSTLERSFVTESIGHATDDERERRRRDVGLRAVFAVVAVLALIASSIAVYLAGALGDARGDRDAAKSALDETLSRQVADEADELQGTSPSLAMQLALTAYELAPTVEARSRLLSLTGGPQVTRLVGPEGSVRAVSRPDGQVIATASSDGVLRFWSGPADAAPELIADLPAAEGGPLYAAAFSPDGQLFATAGSAGVVTVVDVRDPELPVAWSEPLTGPGATVQDLAFSPDGRTLYGATSDPALVRWSLRRGEQAVPLRSVTRFGGAVKSVAASSTGLVATGSADGFVRVWQARPRGLVPLLKLSVGSTANAVHSVAFSPDGRLLAAGSRDGVVRVWSTKAGRLVTDQVGGFDTWVNAVAFSPDGLSLAAGAFGGTARVWRTGTWEQQHELSAPATFSSVQFAPTGDHLLTGAIDGVTRLHQLGGPQLPAFGDDVQGLATPTDGDPVYVGVGTGDAQVVPVDLTDPLLPVVGDPLEVPAVVGTLDGVVAVTADGTTVAAGTETGQVVVWTVAESGDTEPVAVLEAAARPIQSLAFSGDGTTMAASAADGRTRLYELQGDLAPRLLQVLGTNAAAMSVAVNRDSSLVAVGATDNLVHLWTLDGSSAREIATMDLGEVVDSTAFSPDGLTLAAGGADGALQLWDVTSPAAPRPLGRPLPGAEGSVRGVAFDAEGDRLVAAGADGTVSLWDLGQDGATVHARLTGLDGGAHQALFHPSGRIVGAGAGGRMTSWLGDVVTAERLICRTVGTPLSREEWEQNIAGVPYKPPCS
jgi:WD40 repeat protein